ncbi:MAG: Bifunctional protein GlmU [Promethearchaeota archaeon]|nr:MAG: Bifunctional protein GlmU [Candidatus Lokiarchaeota archaeon]
MSNSQVKKAVVLAAGEGKRLKPLTATRPKPMVPVAGKPLLEHILEGLKAAGIEDVLLIVGYKKEVIEEYFGNGKETIGIDIHYKVQDQYLGTAHATGFAKEFVKESPFLLMYGDLLFDNKLFPNIINRYTSSNSEGLITLMEVQNPQNYGIITLNKENYVEKIIEKPKPELNAGNLANAGVYIFDPIIFNAIEKTPKSIRDEYEFTDSMEILVNELNGKIIGHVIENAYWSDIGLPWQLLEANKFFLKNLESEIVGIIEENVHIEGNVYIGKNTIIKSGSYIQGPCFIGENTLIGPNAFIRPNSVIKDHCHIGMSEVKNSIILSDTAVPHFNYIGDSIICENVNLGAGTKVANLRLDEKNIEVSIKGDRVSSGRRKLGTIIGANVKTGINVSIMCGKKIGESARIGAHTIVLEDVDPNTLYYHDPLNNIKKKNYENLK